MTETTTPSYLDADAAPLVFTHAAAGKVRELIAEEGNPELKLRVYISGGGCSGFQYGFTFDEARAEDDLAVDCDEGDPAGRSAEPAVPRRCRDRLFRIADRRAVRDPQSEREDDLRLRFVLHRLTRRP